jgi:hypothetical protein
VADQLDIERAAARPMAYFSHDANSAHDIKCRKLIRREGMAGYGRWWRLCELMAATDGHTLEIGTDEDMELYAEELCLDSAKALMQFLVTLSDVGLIRMPGDGTVYSERMMRNAEQFGEKRANGRMGGRPRKTAVKTNH